MFFMSRRDVSSAYINVTVITRVTDNLKCVYACIYVCVYMHTYTLICGIFFIPDQALQGRRHHWSVCSSDVVRSRASRVAVNCTLRVFSDFFKQTVAKECSVKTSVHLQNRTSNLIVHSPKCCG
jgi:hypothetical protein